MERQVKRPQNKTMDQRWSNKVFFSCHSIFMCPYLQLENIIHAVHEALNLLGSCMLLSFTHLPFKGSKIIDFTSKHACLTYFKMWQRHNKNTASYFWTWQIAQMPWHVPVWQFWDRVEKRHTIPSTVSSRGVFSLCCVSFCLQTCW